MVHKWRKCVDVNVSQIVVVFLIEHVITFFFGRKKNGFVIERFHMCKSYPRDRRFSSWIKRKIIYLKLDQNWQVQEKKEWLHDIHHRDRTKENSRKYQNRVHLLFPQKVLISYILPHSWSLEQQEHNHDYQVEIHNMELRHNDAW